MGLYYTLYTVDGGVRKEERPSSGELSPEAASTRMTHAYQGPQMGARRRSRTVRHKAQVECIADFCESDRILFGTDAPFDTDTVPTSFGSLSLTSKAPCMTKHRG